MRSSVGIAVVILVRTIKGAFVGTIVGVCVEIAVAVDLGTKVGHDATKFAFLKEQNGQKYLK